MIGFKKYFVEKKEMFGMDKYEKLLSSMGYEYKVISGKRISVITDKNRIQVLNDINKEIPGSNYRKDVSYSSVGAVITQDGITILAKPKKSSGSGGGSAMTSLTESAQCLYAAAVWYGKSDFSPENLKKLKSKVDITESIDKIVNDLPAFWQDSSIVISEKLYDEFGGKDYKFHRGSSWVSRLENRFKLLNRSEKEFSNVNKWSPADIYMVSKNAESETFKSANSIVELNSIILKYVRTKDIIPVSLKKTASESASLKYINVDTKNKSTYEIGRPVYTVGKRGFFDSKDVYMNFMNGEIQFRGFNTIDFQGEIKGKYAAHGKIGRGAIANILKKQVGNGIDAPSDVAKRYKNDRDGLYKEFYEYYKEVAKPQISYLKFTEQTSKKDLGWHVSKFLGTQMLYRISKSKKSALDAVIGSMIGYASSESDLSAPHVKVS